jgi:hypothetical protein
MEGLLILFFACGSFAVSTVAPAGCFKLSTDADFPTPEIWKAALPGVIPKSGNRAQADYRFRVKSASHVQKAVKFAKQHNVRVSVITSGHEFSGRNWGTSGLLIDTSLLTGIKVLEEFTATEKGAESPVPGSINVITPQEGKQAAVTIGGGITTQVLNDALSPSKLFTHGAGHGELMVILNIFLRERTVLKCCNNRIRLRCRRLGPVRWPRRSYSSIWSRRRSVA